MLKSILNFSENVLSREEMKQVKGGEFTCSCRQGVGTWYYPGGRPSNGELTSDAINYCGSVANTNCGDRVISDIR